jgi:uncharacterized protein (TIGR03067 family)
VNKLCLLFVALLVLPLLGSDDPPQYDGATEKPELAGSWRYVSYEVGRQRAQGHGTKTYRRGSFVYEYNGHVSGGTFAAGADWLDETFPQEGGRVLKCIYRIDSDTLRIAYKVSGKGERPRGFDDKQDLAIDTYKRVK